MHVWLKDLNTGVEAAVTSSSSSELPWLLSPDGSRLVYCIFGGTQKPEGCFIGPVGGGSARKFCDTCSASSIQDWFDHGRKVLYKKGISADTKLILRDIDSGAETMFLHYPKFSVAAARFSPDERWVSFQIVIQAA